MLANIFHCTDLIDYQEYIVYTQLSKEENLSLYHILTIGKTSKSHVCILKSNFPRNPEVCLYCRLSKSITLEVPFEH